MKAITFDLGDTLLEYEGLPLSWEKHYPDALGALADHLQVGVSGLQMEEGIAILRRFNTRIHPREDEIAFASILREIAECFCAKDRLDECECARAFFRIFRQRLRCYPESKDTLLRLRGRGLKTGVFTDVPYGMPRALVVDDIEDVGLSGTFDVLITSRDAGFRKPSPKALESMASALSCGASEMIYVGNERKDIEAAKRFGCTAVLIDRKQLAPEWGQDRTIVNLTEL